MSKEILHVCEPKYICMHALRVRHCTDISVFTPWCSILMMAKVIMLIDISRHIKMYFNRQLIPIPLLIHLHWGRWLVSFYLFTLFIFMGSPRPPHPPSSHSALLSSSRIFLHWVVLSIRQLQWWMDRKFKESKQGKMWKSGSQTLNQVGFTWFLWMKHLFSKCYIPKDSFCHTSKCWLSFIEWLQRDRHCAKICVCAMSINPHASPLRYCWYYPLSTAANTGSERLTHPRSDGY